MADGVRFSIGLKLSIILSLILFVSVSLITFLVASLVSTDVRLTAESNNWTMNQWSAAAAGNVLTTYRVRTLFLIRTMDVVSREGSANDIENLTASFFRLNPDIFSIAFIGDADSPSGTVINERFIPGQNQNAGFSGKTSYFRGAFSLWLKNREADLLQAGKGKTLLCNASSDIGFPCLVMIFPLPREEGFNFSGAGVLVFSTSVLEKSLFGFSGSSENNATFVINGAAEMLIPPADGYADFGPDNAAVVQQAIANNVNALQTVFTSPGGERYYAAFERLPDMDAAIATQIKESLIIGRVKTEVIKIVMISFIVLILSVLCMALYSRTISGPLRSLIKGVQAIEEGNYEPDLKIKTRDEIGALTGSFISMGRGIAIFERFTNKQVVALARREKLSRKGEKRIITICFVMIKNFATLTQGMDPQHLVDFINRILGGLVPCVTKTGGLIDKFLTQGGIVVLCLWGAGETSGNPVSDAFNCIKSTLMMRNALRGMNFERISGGEPGVLVKMGCGINTGEVIVGQMGSEKRMEYTVIGDAVNLAARIEEPNEAFDTDILITENTWKLVGNYIKTEEMPSLEVKGKSKPARVFSVININNYYGPSTMEEVRQQWTM